MCLCVGYVCVSCTSACTVLWLVLSLKRLVTCSEISAFLPPAPYKCQIKDALNSHCCCVGLSAIVLLFAGYCSKDTLLLDLHPNAKMILGTRNIAFMHGPEHKVTLLSSMQTLLLA